MLLAALFLGERLAPAQWLGGLLLIGGIGGLGRESAANDDATRPHEA